MIEKMPRARIAHLPTPLDEASRLSAALGGPRILIKRDDMTGLAFGGNKTRKLEYLIGDALQKGADSVYTAGAPQSNHCRQTAAAARKAGLRCVLFFMPGHHDEPQGNVLLDYLLKAEIVHSEAESADAVLAEMNALAEKERQQGRKPYIVPVGGSNGVGTLGYVSLVLELANQLFERGISVDRVYFSSGSGGTQGGLLLGKRLYHAPYRLIGVSPGRDAAGVTENVVRTANEGAQVLGAPTKFSAADVEVYDQFTGPAYGVPTPESQEAIRLFAETEGVILDPVYTAKAAAGMIHDIRSGKIGKDETVMFIHTGGMPALFAYHAETMSALRAG
ncbi:MAG: D-cysteine desulfhydrase family protein [Chloroflexi bacterium]|nr:D-cysteine desulfhydrase family protein [Chloroflexota bacterium]